MEETVYDLTLINPTVVYFRIIILRGGAVEVYGKAASFA